MYQIKYLEEEYIWGIGIYTNKEIIYPEIFETAEEAKASIKTKEEYNLHTFKNKKWVGEDISILKKYKDKFDNTNEICYSFNLITV